MKFTHITRLIQNVSYAFGTDRNELAYLLFIPQPFVVK